MIALIWCRDIVLGVTTVDETEVHSAPASHVHCTCLPIQLTSQSGDFNIDGQPFNKKALNIKSQDMDLLGNQAKVLSRA